MPDWSGAAGVKNCFTDLSIFDSISISVLPLCAPNMRKITD